MSPSSLPRFDRREVLLGAGALAFTAATPCAVGASSRPFVTSETGTLRKALVHAATAADHMHCDAVTHGGSSFWWDAADDVAAQHAQMVLQLESTGAQILRLQEVLESAVDSARQRGVPSSVVTMFEGQVGQGLSYVRDFAVMLPKGLVLCNAADAARERQQALFRFVIEFAPAFRGYPVLFDAAAAGLRAEGGDIQVLDEQTLLVGVGNHTDPRIAAALARTTGIDVIAVNIRNADPARWRIDHDPLRDFFLHLNTSVAQIDRGHLLALPWLFEAAHTGHAALRRADRLIADFGTIEKYRAWSGECDPTAAGLKLVDYLRTRGMTVSFVNGTGGDDLDRWLAEAAETRAIFPMRERQAANILATSPGSLIAFMGAERTHKTLRDDGMSVRTVMGCEMWRGYGGPHCLTLPLERS